MAAFRELYNGVAFDEIPQRVLTFSTSPCGRFAYMLGERTYFALDAQRDLVMLSEYVVFEHDIRSGTSSSFNLDLEDLANQEILDFYMLDEFSHAVLIVNCLEKSSIVQHLIKFDRKRGITDTVFTKSTRFSGMLSGRVGLGGAHLGYIVVTGNTSEQEGSALVGMLLAADPSKTDRFPTISLDKELGLMEAKIKEVNEDFYIWPKAIPMVTKKRIYFPVCRRYDLQLYFHADHLACIELGKSGLTPAVQETTAIEDLEGYYNINDANMMVQRGSCTWLTFIQPGSDDDWRWNLQYYAVIGCTFLLRYVGGFTLWMSRYDRGRSALLFAKFYTWLVGPSLFPNFGPEPSFDAYVLDMDRWVYKGIEYKTNCKELQNNTQVLVDVNTKGNATFFELNRMRMARIGYFTNPFRPQTLYDLALGMAETVKPELRTDFGAMKKWGIGRMHRTL